MDKNGGWDSKNVVSVLTQGKDLANELRKQLKPHPHPTLALQTCDSLLDKILSSYDKALGLLDCISLLQTGAPALSQSRISSTPVMDSPCSIETSPRSEGFGSDQDSKDLVPKLNLSKKRKTMSKWSEQVRVRTGATVSEGQVDDGYHWRKYGQKDILGSTFPRAYYRCTHRNTQGCLATKQVQRADDDPSVCVVVYKGKHSCIPERSVKHKKEENVMIPKKQEGNCQEPLQEMVITGLKPKTQDFNTKDHFSCFSIPSTPTDVDGLLYENNVDNSFLSEQSSLVETSCGSPHQFLSPATAESQCPIDEFALGHSPDFPETICIPSSAFSMQIADLDSFNDMSFDMDYWK